MFGKPVAPYQIPYGVIVPRETVNLVVQTACNASHVGFCAIRLEPIWMALGGAAGHAAALALRDTVSVQHVNVQTVQDRIRVHGQATIHVSDVPATDPDFHAVQWWAGLGALHGLEAAPSKPGDRGQHITSQYFEAFPGHAACLNQPLKPLLRERSSLLAKKHGLSIPGNVETRRDWIRQLFEETRAHQ